MSKFAELREKLEAATQGEWYWTEYDGKGALTLAVTGPTLHILDMIVAGHERNILKTTSDWPPTQEDAELIVAAVNALPELLQIAEAAEAYKAAYESVTGQNLDENISLYLECEKAKEALFAALEQGNE